MPLRGCVVVLFRTFRCVLATRLQQHTLRASSCRLVRLCVAAVWLLAVGGVAVMLGGGMAMPVGVHVWGCTVHAMPAVRALEQAKQVQLSVLQLELAGLATNMVKL